MSVGLGALLVLLASRGREAGGTGTPSDAPRGLSPQPSCRLKAARMEKSKRAESEKLLMAVCVSVAASCL